MLELIHETHFGIEKCEKCTTDLIYWTGMNTDIMKITSGCETCKKYKTVDSKEPLIPSYSSVYSI